jgi:hypothetical protein
MKPFTNKEIQTINDQVNTWFLRSRPRAPWWRVPNVDRVKASVTRILSVARLAIVFDGLLEVLHRHQERASQNRSTWLHYETLSGDNSEVVIERFKGLEEKELGTVQALETLLDKVRANGLPDEALEYIPEITIDVF